MDIAEANDQSCYGDSISTLIRRLFAEGIQLMVAFTTRTEWVLQYYIDKDMYDCPPYMPKNKYILNIFPLGQKKNKLLIYFKKVKIIYY